MTDPPWRLHLVGSSGAGKTTVGRRVAAALGLPFVDLDDLFWDPGWRDVGHAELARRLQAALPALDAPDAGWVIAGNYGPTTEPCVWPHLTHLVVLDLPLPTVLARTGWRTLARCVTGRPCCNGNRESLARVLSRDGVIRYLLRTWRRRRDRHAGLAALPALAHAEVVHLRSRAEVRDWLRGVVAGAPR